MAGKPKPKKHEPKEKYDYSRETLYGDPDEEKDVMLSQEMFKPTVQGAATLIEYGKAHDVELDLVTLVNMLGHQAKATNEGNFKRGEAMLTVQAHTLDITFNMLARQAITAKRIENLERYLKLALRAQSQCRATWEALANIKNPPMIGYAKQANIAQGHQQVNNPPSVGDTPRARENKKAPNELLEEQHVERLDTGKAATAGGIDTQMATVGAIHRTENSEG